MELLPKPENWQCVPTSFAMVLGIPVAQVIAEIGHDGGELLPGGRRGHHVQEMIDLCLRHGFAVTPIEACPVSQTMTGQTYAILAPARGEDRFLTALATTQGVIEGVGSYCGHMVAYDHGRIFDPDNGEYSYLDLDRHSFHPFCAWRIDPITKVQL